MKNTFLALIFQFLFLSFCYSKERQPVDWVNPQIGATHCRWFFYTPAALPFGMVKLAPTTNAYGSKGLWYPNGYDDRHTSIEGFAHLHEFQIGGIVTMPTIGNLKTLPGAIDDPDAGYRSRFNKKTEKSMPGYYSVVLSDYNIKVELTATERVGYHRYTYPKSTKSRILFDIGHPQGESGRVKNTEIYYDRSTNTIKGFVECYPEYAKFCDPNNHVKCYFYIQISKKISNVGTYRDSLIYDGQTEIKGVGSGLYIEFPTEKNEKVEMQVALSYTSIENAKKNLAYETKNMDFDTVKINAKKRWNEMLSRIEVKGGTDVNMTKFYTGLYHALLGRGIANDVDGSYITHDKQIAKIKCDKNGIPLYHHHNTDGIWGGFWNITQVWALAYPEIYASYVKSTLDFTRYTEGWMHDGEAAGVYTNGVQTNFQGLVTCAAYNAGLLNDIDTDYLWKIIYQNELGYKNRPYGAGRWDNNYWANNGYIPSQDYNVPHRGSFNFCVSHTLEYCFAAYAASQVAESLDKKAEANLLKQYANNYTILFDKEIGYMHPKERNGEFTKNFDPMKAWEGFQEGNAAQYTWYVPHDIKGLISLLGKDSFNNRLKRTLFESSKTEYGGRPNDYDSFSGVEFLYNHGNQPCLHNAWLFNYSSKPWLTQYFTRDICNRFYGITPTHGYGYGQDEDQGQLGAWFVLAAIGLFDVQGLTNNIPTMQISSPLFKEITIHLNQNFYKGDTFKIVIDKNNESNCYIQSAKLNGNDLKECFIPLNYIQRGGLLELKLGEKPNKKWGIEKMPPSMSDVK